MKLANMIIAAGVVMLIGGAGCKQAKQEAPAPQSQAQPSAGAEVSMTGGPLSGKIVETMNSGGYTYLSLENNGKRTWVAIPDTKVKVGQQVTCQPGMEMKNFPSKTLNRTFDSIIFSGGIIK